MRKLGYVQSSMWFATSDFQHLTMGAQHLYLLLITQSSITTCGTLDLAPKRWAGMSRTQTVKGIEKAIAELERDHYIVVDRVSEELWIRTFLKHNKVVQQPKMLRNAQEVYPTIASDAIRHGIWSQYPEHFPQPATEIRGVMGNTDTPSDTLSDRVSGGDPGSILYAPARALVEDSDSDSEEPLLSSSPVERILGAYREHHPRFAVTPTRKALVTRRLRDFDEPTLIDAINGNHADPWCNGENPNHRQYHALELILRDAEKIEKYAALAHADQNGKRPPTAEEARRAEKAAAEFDRIRAAAGPIPDSEELSY